MVLAAKISDLYFDLPTSKQKLHLHDLKTPPPFMRLCLGVFYDSEVIGQTNVFLVKAPVTLTFDPVTSKSMGGHLLIMTNLHAKYENFGSKES
jgi:hypothetical protein